MSRISPPLKALCCSLWLALTALPAQAAELRDLQLRQQDGRVKAIVELSEQATFKVFTLASPDRIVVDIAGTKAGRGLRMPVVFAPIKSVRSGITGDGGLRLVFDLLQPAMPQSRIERDGGRSRLTVDLGVVAVAATPSSQVRPVSPVNLPTADDAPVDVFSVPEDELLRQAGLQPVAKLFAVPPSAPISAAPKASAPMPVVNLEPAKVVAQPPAVNVEAQLAGMQPMAEVAAPPLPASARTLRDVLGPGERKLVIAIDAGHGGKDPGALGPTGKHEKHVTLALARELARLIDADPGMKAVLIRDSDVFVPLQDRYMRARAAQADLFISIHADAAENHSANGASVFVLSTRGASSQAARWLADKENAADLVGGLTLDGKDKNLAAVLLDLSQSATMRMSEDMAGNVLDAIKEVGRAHKQQVERANFVVLRSPDVPSMLVETGFITNPDEEARLSDPAYRRKLAKAIASGVREYFTRQPPPGTWYASRQSQPDSQSVGTPSVAPRRHVVGRGETLTHIAAVHGVPVSSLRQANNKHDDIVRIGERLRIPVLVASVPN